MAAFRLADLARELGARVVGDPDLVLNGPAPLDRAGPGDLSFLANPLYRNLAASSLAGAVLLRPADHAALENPESRSWLLHDNPYEAFARALELF